jgi:hypothetical protein
MSSRIEETVRYRMCTTILLAEKNRRTRSCTNGIGGLGPHSLGRTGGKDDRHAKHGRPRRRSDRVVYADPDVCKRLYTGTEAQYQQFQRLALEKRLADEQLMTAQNNLSAAIDWGLWGPWPY